MEEPSDGVFQFRHLARNDVRLFEKSQVIIIISNFHYLLPSSLWQDRVLLFFSTSMVVCLFSKNWRISVVAKNAIFVFSLAFEKGRIELIDMRGKLTNSGRSCGLGFATEQLSCEEEKAFWMRNVKIERAVFMPSGLQTQNRRPKNLQPVVGLVSQYFRLLVTL
ncbi:hypothetical protein CEXT_72921 [Caerostris extrusa]|uniref:Uncharacterized protein n=1 Tax=Caerostris extrusa TaxID=172846 RepID=A0AAV4R426_CAEEX|nr:hypothetical protein CEXT_72921 [Caerostris extrusa]